MHSHLSETGINVKRSWGNVLWCRIIIQLFYYWILVRGLQNCTSIDRQTATSKGKRISQMPKVRIPSDKPQHCPLGSLLFPHSGISSLIMRFDSDACQSWGPSKSCHILGPGFSFHFTWAWHYSLAKRLKKKNGGKRAWWHQEERRKKNEERRGENKDAGTWRRSKSEEKKLNQI